MNKKREILSTVAAVKNTAGETPILGYLTWYSVGEAPYYRTELRKKLLLNGIEERFLPKEIRPSDAFRRATKAIQTKRFREVESNKEYKNYIIRTVVSKGERLQKNIVIETVNQEGEMLDYNSEGAKLYFDKKNNQFNYVSYDQHAEDLAEEALKLFELFSKAHNGATVRGSVVNYMNTLSPTPVRPSGGVYFIPVKYEEKLRKLVNYVSSLEKGESHMIPLINDDENKQMIRNKVKDHLDKIISQCRAAIADDEGKFQKGQITTLIDEARRTVAQFKDYKELLADTIVDLESSVELVRNSINAIMQKAVS